MATMTLMGSVQLVVLGVLGEYVGRMYEQVKGRPLFIVERVVRSAASPDHDGDTVAACNDDHARTHRPASVPPSEAH
jgi:polyisoprenyl-phosphate glycosyltransferase